jgi:predicted ATPase
VHAPAESPSARRSFVGREHELAQIGRAFGDGVRLVTVTGSAGTGKTRLAERFLELSAADASREGAWFCPLSQVETAADLCLVVGQALGLRFGGRSVDQIAEAIARALAQRGRSLVVLDNLEHIVEQAVPLLELWQDEAPETEFLITSQERLRLADERCISIGPLPASDAVRLFVERARAANPEFGLDASNAEYVAAIVKSLDGIPLAIELAAARVGMLALPELGRLLERRFEVLITDRPGIVERHATLRGAIDWSWELLSPPAQAALARCSVFKGGFSLESFERVAEADAGTDGVSALDLLQALHDKSFLTASSPVGISGERRFSLYESIRVYARERLAAEGALERTERRHAEYFLDAAERWTAKLEGSGGADARRRLQLDRENLLAAHERGILRGDAHGIEWAVRAMLPLEVVFAMQGPFEHYVGLLDAALASARAATLPPALNARARLSRGRMHVVQGRFAEALHDFRRAAELAERAGDQRLEALAALKGGYAAAMEGRADEAELHFARAERQIIVLHDEGLERQYAADLGLVRAEQGRIDEALAFSERALSLAQRLGNRREEGVALGNTGARLNELRRLDAARDCYQRAIEILNEIGDRRAVAVFEAHLANMDLERADTASAKRRLMRALALHREVGDWAWEGLIQGFLGHVALFEGQTRHAASLYREASAILPGSYRRWAGLFLSAQAAAEARLGYHTAAKQHLANAHELIQAVGAPSDHLVWELFGALVEVASRRAGAGDAARSERAARALVARVRGDDAARALPDEVRFALTILDRELAPKESPCLPSSPWSAALRIAADGSWFELSPAERVDLGRRAALRRMLVELAEAQRAAPGVGLELDRLFESAWPGARIRPESRSARVYVAIATLRKLGLGGVLLRQDDGYLLHPGLTASFVSE